MEISKTNSEHVVGEIETRMSKGASKQITNLTLDFTGVTRDQLIGLAKSTVVIDLQAVYRNTQIPATDVVDVVKFLGRPRGEGGFKPTPENMAARINKMEKPAYIETLVKMGLDEKQAQKMADKKYAAEVAK